MTPERATQQNRNIAAVVLFVTLACALKLFSTARETNNWPGAWFSLAHVALVGVGAFLALRERG